MQKNNPISLKYIQLQKNPFEYWPVNGVSLVWNNAAHAKVNIQKM